MGTLVGRDRAAEKICRETREEEKVYLKKKLKEIGILS